MSSVKTAKLSRITFERLNDKQLFDLWTNFRLYKIHTLHVSKKEDNTDDCTYTAYISFEISRLKHLIQIMERYGPTNANYTISDNIGNTEEACH